MRGEKTIGQNSEADDDKKMKFIKFYRYQRGSKIPAILKLAANKLNVPPSAFCEGYNAGLQRQRLTRAELCRCFPGDLFP
jgi:hypothetical protein